MKIHLWTQDSENYGSAEQPYWKMKGGEDFFISLPSSVTERGHVVMILAQSIVNNARAKIELNDDFARRYIIGFDIVEDDYVTEFEKSQLEYDGKIIYPTQVLDIA
jgi:hypothetical protein